MIVPIPLLDAMPPIACEVMASEVARFAAIRSLGEDVPALVVAANQSGSLRVNIYLEEDATSRAKQVALATTIMASRDRASSALWLCDTFMSARSLGSSLDVAPSEDPAAVEALTIVYASEGASWTVALPYARDDDGGLRWLLPDLGWTRSPGEIDSAPARAVAHGLAIARSLTVPDLPPDLLDAFGIEIAPRTDPRAN